MLATALAAVPQEDVGDKKVDCIQRPPIGFLLRRGFVLCWPLRRKFLSNNPKYSFRTSLLRRAIARKEAFNP